MASACTRPHKAPEHPHVPVALEVVTKPPSDVLQAVPPQEVSPQGDNSAESAALQGDAVDPTLVYTGRSTDEYLEQARDVSLPLGTRATALQMFARTARDEGAGAHAAQVIYAMKGQLETAFGDAVYDALALTGAPSAIALILSGGEIVRCDTRDAPGVGVTVQTLQDPSATVVLEVSAELTAMSSVFVLVQDSPDSAEAAAAVPELISALRCGDERVRLLAGKSIGNVHRLTAKEAASMRELLTHPRPQTRVLAASLLALAPAPKAATLKALERALTDSAELVRLAAAGALMRVGKPEAARATLQKLALSSDAEVAATAAMVLREHEEAQ